MSRPAKKAKVSIRTSGDDENNYNHEPKNEGNVQMNGNIGKECDERNEEDNAELRVHD